MRNSCVNLDPDVHLTAKLAATLRRLSLKGYISELIKQDTEKTSNKDADTKE